MWSFWVGFAGCSIASFGSVGLSKRGIWFVGGAAMIKKLMAVELWLGGAEELGRLERFGKTVQIRVVRGSWTHDVLAKVLFFGYWCSGDEIGLLARSINY